MTGIELETKICVDPEYVQLSRVVGRVFQVLPLSIKF